jgi:hypothetical protein
MKSVSLKFKLPLPLLLLLIFGALAVITLFIDLKIIDDFSQASSDTVAGKSLELNQNLYQIILNNNKTSFSKRWGWSR